MKKILLLLLVSFCAFVAFRPAPTFKGAFKKLSALAGGSWQMKTPKGIFGERWQKVSSTQLQSQAFKISGKDTALLEKVTLEQKDGEIWYMPVIKDQNGGKQVSFKLTNYENNRFDFTNPEHDFPQRIVYQFVSKDSIHAWIDGKLRGKYKKEDFYYKRVKD